MNEIKNQKIGVYDSGVGGLTVLMELTTLMPKEQYIYFGDLKNLPYGEKSEDELYIIGKKIFDFFEQQNVKAVVMACNTTSALLYDKIKDDYSFKIYPVIQTVSKYLSQLDIKSMGIFATVATINSHAYKKEILKYTNSFEIFEQACPQWVKIVESKDYSQQNIEIIKNNLFEMLQNNPQKIVLGCTHYPYLTEILSKYVPKDMFINPAKKFAELIYNDLKSSNLLSNMQQLSEIFYVSKNPEQFKQNSKMFYEVKEFPVLLDNL